MEKNPSLQILIHEKTVPLIATGANNKNNGGGLVNRTIYLLFRIKQMLKPEWDLTFPPFIVPPEVIVLKGEKIDLQNLLGIDASVFLTPGHTSDSLSLVVDKKYLLCGDLATNFLNWAGASHLTVFNENLENLYNSWQQVIDMGIKTIVPSHGKPFSSQKLKENLHKYSQADLVRFF